MRRIICTIGFIISFLSFGHSQQINWMSWEEAVEASKQEKKKYFVEVYTQWCGWCKKMDNNTFNQEYIIEYVNEKFYPIKFDAESKKEITINSQTYKFIRSGRRGYHQLAAEITRGQLSYPTIVFLDENLNIIQPIPGYRNPKDLEMILKYFGEDHHISTPWKKYTRNYNVLTGRKNY